MGRRFQLYRYQWVGIPLLLVPEVVSQALIRDDYSLTNALIGVTTLFSLVFITSALMHRSKRIETLIDGVPAVLVRNGAFISETMNKEPVSPEEVLNEAHKAGLERIDQIRWAILETDGKIAIVPTDPAAAGQDQSDESTAIV